MDKFGSFDFTTAPPLVSLPLRLPLTLLSVLSLFLLRSLELLSVPPELVSPMYLLASELLGAGTVSGYCPSRTLVEA